MIDFDKMLSPSYDFCHTCEAYTLIAIMASNDESKPECGVCSEPFDDTSLKIIDGSPVCGDCIKSEILPMFTDAVKYIAKYPARWGGSVVLRPEDFADLLEPETIAAYNDKEAEYRCAEGERVYCSHSLKPPGPSTNERCNSFLGRRFDKDSETERPMSAQYASSNPRYGKTCDQCQGTVCMKLHTDDFGHYQNSRLRIRRKRTQSRRPWQNRWLAEMSALRIHLAPVGSMQPYGTYIERRDLKTNMLYLHPSLLRCVKSAMVITAISVALVPALQGT